MIKRKGINSETYHSGLYNSLTLSNFTNKYKDKSVLNKALQYLEEDFSSGFSYPFVVFGSDVSGRSHLLNAIGNSMMEHNKFARIIYLSADDFCNHLEEASRQNSALQFLESYQNIDCLIIDELQYIKGNNNANDFLFWIMNHLLYNGKKVVISCDCDPNQLVDFKKRLISRLTCGIILELKATKSLI